MAMKHSASETEGRFFSGPSLDLLAVAALAVGLLGLGVVLGPLGEPPGQALGAFGVSTAIAALGRVAILELKQGHAPSERAGSRRARRLLRLLLVVGLTALGILTFSNGGAAAGLTFGLGLEEAVRRARPRRRR